MTIKFAKWVTMAKSFFEEPAGNKGGRGRGQLMLLRELKKIREEIAGKPAMTVKIT
jgi:hypothetical protein